MLTESIMSDKENAAIVEDLNRSFATQLLQYGWHTLNISIAQDVKLTFISDKSFTTVTQLSRNKTREDTYAFSSAEMSNEKGVKKRVLKVLKKAAYAQWPPKAIPSIALWIIGALVVSQQVSTTPYLSTAKEFLLTYLFKKEINGWYFLTIMLGLHILETSIVSFYLLRPVKMSLGARLSWAAWCLLLGYPITERAYFLNRKHYTSLKQT